VHHTLASHLCSDDELHPQYPTKLEWASLKGIGPGLAHLSSYTTESFHSRNASPHKCGGILRGRLCN